MNNIRIISNPSASDYEQLVKRPQFDKSDLDEIISDVYDSILKRGDEALIDLTRKFDKTELSSISVSALDIDTVCTEVPENLKEAIRKAKQNIEKFHQAQQPVPIEVETMPGVWCRQKAVPIQRVGIYIPGGTAPLFSTILMLAIPAKIAGCTQISLCSPPTHHGKIHPVILFTAKECGIHEVYQVGGAQAIAAMAVGTKSIQKVDKIFGPGNQYVTAAKEKAQQYHTAIDMPAGPSEVLVYTDETGVPAYIAADLLSQAEHGIDSQVVCVCKSHHMAEQIVAQVYHQIQFLPRMDIASKCLENSFIIIEESDEKAFEYINSYAPEHLIIASETPGKYESMIFNAGSVFMGNLCPEAVGDYASGTNHTLPTYGWATSYSGVNLDAFMKKITFQTLDSKGLHALGDIVITMAEAEQLKAHANAVRIRLDLPLNQ